MNGNAYAVFCVIFSIGLVISLIFGVTTLIMLYSDQIEDIESIQKETEDKVIYQAKRKELTDVFKQYLAEQYPDYEKEIFNKLLPDNITAVATVFPEIKASETITSYCNRISGLADSIYNRDLAVNSLRKRIRVRLRNRMEWWFLLPKE